MQPCVMSETTTIRIGRATHDELRELVRRHRTSLGETVARALTALRQEDIGRDLARPITPDEAAWLDADAG